MLDEFDPGEADEEYEEGSVYHYDSRFPATLNALAIHAPIVMIGSLASIAAVLYNINEVHMIHTDSQDQESAYCTDSLNLHLLNGICTRGQTFDIDIEKSCIQWTDTAKWAAIDQENLYRYTLYDSQSRFFGIQNKTFVVSNLEEEAETLWPILGTGAYIAIGCTIANTLITVISLDSDYFHNRIGIEDVDKLVLVGSTLCVGAALAFYAYLGYFSWFLSEITKAESWTNKDCDFTSTPSIGMYAIVISSVFAVSSFLLSLLSYFYWYFVIDTLGVCLPPEVIAKNEEERLAAENVAKEKKRKKEEKEKKKLNGVAFNNKVQPDPETHKHDSISSPERVTIVSPTSLTKT